MRVAAIIALSIAISVACVVAEIDHTQEGVASGEIPDSISWDVVKNVAVHKSDSGAPCRLEFDTHGCLFTVEVVPETNDFADSTVMEGNVALIGTRLTVRDQQSVLYESSTPDLARFVVSIDADKPMLLGTLEYEGLEVTLKMNNSVLNASKGPLGWMPKGPGGNALRCGSDSLPFNRQYNEESLARRSASLKASKMAGRRVLSGAEETPRNLASSLSLGHLGMARKIDEAELSWIKHTEDTMDQCPKKPKQLPVAVVADCNYVASMGGQKAARKQLLSELNTVSGIFYKSFHVSLAVTSLLIYSECDHKDVWDAADVFNIPCSQYPGLETILNRFSRWRDSGLGDSEAPSAAIVHLVTSCHYSDNVGFAWLNQVCRTRSFTDSLADTISGTSVSVAVFPQDGKASKADGSAPLQHYAVIAHEMAHNLGAIHDCSPALSKAGDAGEDVACNGKGNQLGGQCCRCPNSNGESGCGDRFIMSENIGSLLVRARSGGKKKSAWPEAVFSPCTISDVCGKLAYLGGCLLDEDGSMDHQSVGAQNSDYVGMSLASIATNLIATCGNGVREGSEQCDCGSEEQCLKDPCCNPDCTLKPHAVCSDSNDVCCSKCQYIKRSQRVLCRASDMSHTMCVEDSYCDGYSGLCPPSAYKVDGLGCGDTLVLKSSGLCASGVCTSRDEQCAIFGRHLQLTKACPYTKRSCSIICEQGDQCIDLSANFVDGTPCGENGSCRGGMCSEFGSGASDKTPRPSMSIVRVAFVFFMMHLALNIAAII